MILVGSLSLMGFPFLTGFYSKDLILELTYDKYYIIFAYWLGAFSALLTAFYSIRLIYLTFITDTNSRKEDLLKVHEPSWNIMIPLLLLAFGSIFVGYLGKEIVLSNVVSPIISSLVKVGPLLLSLLGATLALIIYNNVIVTEYKWNISKEMIKWIRKGYHVIYTFFNSAWQFNYIINHFFVNNIWKFGHLITYRIIDRGILEIIGPRGISKVLIKLTQIISNFQSGMVFNYALVMIVFTTLFLSGVTIF